MIKTGLTSVTFRQKSVEEILALAKEAGLTGVEWGGDIHVPAGAVDIARETGRKTREAGLEVLSYGSYYRGDPGESFTPILESALALGAPLIRIWAGRTPYESCPTGEWNRLTKCFQRAADAAQQAGIRLAFEYHRGTATQTITGALALLRDVDRANVGCYWQPNPDISQEERVKELEALAPFLANVHVFTWSKGNIRHPLSQGEPQWKEYLAHLPQDHLPHCLILEFVQDDRVTAFREDAKTLRRWTAQWGAVKEEHHEGTCRVYQHQC